MRTPYPSRQLVFFAFKMQYILGDIFNVLHQDVVYALGTGSTSTGVHTFDL